MNTKIKRKYMYIVNVVYNKMMWNQLILIKNSLQVYQDVEFQFITRTPLIGKKKNRMKVTNNRQKIKKQSR